MNLIKIFEKAGERAYLWQRTHYVYEFDGITFNDWTFENMVAYITGKGWVAL